MSIKVPGIVFASFLLCFVGLAEDVPVYYSAESSNINFTDAGEPEEIFLQGNVKIVFEDITILCEEAKFNIVTGEITVEEPVLVEIPEGTFKAGYLTYNINEEKGVLSNSSFSIPPLYGKSNKVHREGGSIILENGYMTSCDQEHPHFRISAEKMEYVKNDYIRAEKMRLTFGKNFSVFYFPRYTIDVSKGEAKESPVTIKPAYNSDIGKSVDFIFSHKRGRESDTLLKERISVGTEGLGFGLETLSERKGFNGSGFIFNRWGNNYLEPGGLFEFGKGYDSRPGPGRIIVDWRWMDDNEFFNDFFPEEFLQKSKTYNYLSYTHNFTAGILNLNLRHSAGEDFLEVEKRPELQFYTPLIKIYDLPVFLENDLRLTNFHKKDEDYVRMMDILTVKGKKDAGYLTFAPYVSIGGINYHSDVDEDRFNLLREFGGKISTTLKKDHTGWMEYFTPSISFFYRGLDYEPGEIETFDRIERWNDGKFVNLQTDWFFAGDEGSPGRISLENIYSLDRGQFEGNLLRYEIRITPKLSIEGEDEWDITDMDYRFGVNDLIYQSGKYSYSLGNRYDDESDSSGIVGRFTHLVNENWRYTLGLQYDVNEGSFTRESLEVWRKLHCWELNIRLSDKDGDFSFFFIAYPIFL